MAGTLHTVGHSEIAQRTARVSNVNQSINRHHHKTDHIGNSHLTKINAFRVNRDQVIDLEIRLKSIQTSLMLSEHPPKPNFCQFVTTVKSHHSSTI